MVLGLLNNHQAPCQSSPALCDNVAWTQCQRHVMCDSPEYLRQAPPVHMAETTAHKRSMQYRLGCLLAGFDHQRCNFGLLLSHVQEILCA